ncbi:short chain dehydrogenase [Rhizobium leguminosarum]|jgi:NAD(P)-dependent dehydrogenase (short-subunit alcohol dehydrogenase family)|uniref:Short chain dehydrogenase n=2 Tax=Rhizobium TaxID=379 RepID=A0A4Q8XZY5_RHILE|nr:short chain dehydrogenase [Rhizobium leguminosarum]TAV88416.1 short chain dehydrogenase [Rhizobium leguminosarum]TAV92995.1 short chain dehydrogenase [Rhizobium leguminosarum]TAW34072.1 short chain dehydrogenase [Rhizobium leguminosarum]TAX59391.1 short chain dehydrogenase [Rhizobium leguminosarum]TAX70945.1 short chain dehydrogenase [Rhizobium leguminosarum]
MKIVVIGASGDVGRFVVEELARDGKHDIIRVGRTQGDHQVDITSDESVDALFKKIGRIDAIIVAAGNVILAPIAEMTTANFHKGLQDKLLSQVRVVLVGQHYLNDGGSITLTSGIAVDDPIAQGSNAATSNAGLEGFVRAAACDFSRGIRINAVNPTMLTESMNRFGPFFPGYESVSGARVAMAYRRSVEGVQTGRVYRVGH